MTRWIDNSIADRLYILDHVSSLKDITPESVEKDWWVTAVLQCVFELTAAPYMYFKGGTSLSKGWRLIDRFSEDIDIALYRDFFLNELHRSCAACETNNQIMNLRKVSRDYVTTVLKAELEERLKANGLTGTSIEAVTTRQTSEGEKPIDHDSDPTVLNVHYKSILSPADKYIRPVVKIEISCLSLKEPYQIQPIRTIISEHFPEEDTRTASAIPTVTPVRTFLEKAFLLNEEYQRPNPRTIRMSRHLYDLERMMDTPFASQALADAALYRTIVEHRRRFYRIKGIDYDTDLPDRITFCPTGQLLDRMAEDYRNMTSSFIYGTPPDFDTLIARIRELQDRFRHLTCHEN